MFAVCVKILQVNGSCSLLEGDLITKLDVVLYFASVDEIEQTPQALSSVYLRLVLSIQQTEENLQN